MSQRSVEVMELVRFDDVFRRAVDGCNCERANPVLNGYAGCLKVVSVVTAVEMMFYASFDEDCCAAVCSSVRVLRVISGVVGEFEVVPRGKVRFRYEMSMISICWICIYCLTSSVCWERPLAFHIIILSCI